MKWIPTWAVGICFGPWVLIILLTLISPFIFWLEHKMPDSRLKRAFFIRWNNVERD